jgi:hypothetical protein
VANAAATQNVRDIEILRPVRRDMRVSGLSVTKLRLKPPRDSRTTERANLRY